MNFVIDVLATVSDADISHSLLYRYDANCNSINFFIECNDLFNYACADAESLTKENLWILKKCIFAVRHVCQNYAYGADILFVATIRQKKPLARWFDIIDPRMVHLFDILDNPEK